MGWMTQKRGVLFWVTLPFAITAAFVWCSGEYVYRRVTGKQPPDDQKPG